MTLPTFLVCGAPKTGTTSLHGYLDQHPDVYMSPVKEPHFFNRSYGKGLDWYASLFEGSSGQKALGECTTWYMFSPEAPARIANDLPGVRLVFCLRHPVDRAYSHYWFRARINSLKAAVDFSDIIRGKEDDEDLVAVGFYADQLKRYLEHFPREQLLVTLYDDLRADSAAYVSRIFEFIGVDPNFQVNTREKEIVTQYPRFHRLHRTLLRAYVPVERMVEQSPLAGAWKGLEPIRATAKGFFYDKKKRPRPSMSAADREYLHTVYDPQIQWLEEFLGRDLSHWRK